MPERGQPTLYHALIAFAAALGITGFMFGIGSLDDARDSSPEYWHYKHHWLSPGTNDDCTDGCQFIKNTKNVSDSLENDD